MLIKKEDKEFRCIFCGSKLSWSNTEMCSDVGDYADDDDAMISFFRVLIVGENMR